MAHEIDGRRAVFFTRATNGQTIPLIALEGEPEARELDFVTVSHIQRAATESGLGVDGIVARLNKSAGYTPDEVQAIIDSSIAASFKVKP